METKSAWEKYDAGALGELEDIWAEYIQFITENKTEREFAAAAIAPVAPKTGAEISVVNVMTGTPLC